MDPYLGEIRLFAGSYAPAGWLFCQGQLLYVGQYPALYTILGNTYGGTAPTTFNLPDLRGRALLHFGAGPGLTPRPMGSTTDASAVQLDYSQMPAHTHTAQGAIDNTSQNPGGALWGGGVPGPGRGTAIYATTDVDSSMSPQAIRSSGGNLPHNNMQPYLPINYIISIDGTYPVRS